MERQYGQAASSVFFRQLDVCCQKIAAATSPKPVTEWVNADYIRLSHLLYRKTKVHLSENTLKRIFGKLKTTAAYFPQKATRDALAQFTGYADWYAFELDNPVTVDNVEIPLAAAAPVLPASPAAVGAGRRRWPYRWLLPAAVVIMMVGFFVFRKNQAKPGMLNARLECVNPQGSTPHSAIFKLHLPPGAARPAAGYQIDFADGRGRKTSLLGDTVVSHYYETPGRYYPVLYYNDVPIDTAFVYLQTNGWTATVSSEHDTTRVYPVNAPAIADNKNVSVSIEQVAAAGVDTNRTFFIHYTNIQPSRISGDNFELTAHLTGSADRPGIRCSQADIIIFGEKDWHYLGIIRPACTAWDYYKFSENKQDGQKSDLRALGYDTRAGATVRLIIRHQQVSVFMEGKQVFATSYRQPIGRIMGIKVLFGGAGRFSDLVVRDLVTGQQL